MIHTALRRSAAVAAAGALLIATAAGQPSRADTPATTAGAGIPGTGSIVYVRNNDLWLTTPDRSRTQRVTWDGSTKTADHSGGVGYVAPSQSNSGLVVAVRNQKGAGGYPTGWLWVMNRQGAVIRKFAPLQHTIAFSTVDCSPVPYQYNPEGIVNAIVSPDGTKIAYVERGNWRDDSCHLESIWSTFVVGIDGTGAHQVRQSDHSPWDLEAGSWASSTRLVLARTLAGDEQLMYADAPHFTAQAWWRNPDSSDYDAANASPSLRHGVVATVGLSSFSATRVLRLWSTDGPPAAATPRCEYAATGGGADSVAERPTMSPDGTGVAWFEQGTSGGSEVAGEGVYVMRTGTPATSCPADGSKVLLVQGGYMPFWGPADVTAAPHPSLRINSVSVHEGAHGTRNAVFTVTRTGNAAPTVEVKARTASRTATSGVDFRAVSVRLQFKPGQRSRTLSVPIYGDRRHEHNETFRVKLSSPAGARIAVSYGTGTIVNDDPAS